MKSPLYSLDLKSSCEEYLRIFYSLGYHHHFYQHYPGVCYPVDGIDFGAGDFSIAQEDGLVFISSGWNLNIFSESFQAYYKKHNINGAIYLLNMKENVSSPIKLDMESAGTDFNVDTFRPRGISVWPNTTSGEHVVFVVSHPPKEVNRIEKFHFDPKRLVLHHVKTYTSDHLRLVYDIQALSEDSFYITNILYENRVRFFMILELFSLMPWSSVMYYKEGTGFQEVLPGLTSATGIVMSYCGTYVYVLLCMISEVRVYVRQKDNRLLLQQVFPLYTHPDNVHIDPSTGDLYIGSHPIAYQYLNHLDKPEQHKAASQVLHLRIQGGNIVSVTELLYDNGDLISGSSSAVVYNKSLLVGSTLDKFIVCHLSTTAD